ncbi:MAG: cytochrome d ubiquinol oxidase subunit II, partial [Cyanobacteria bacterium P01_A01_bin.3]
LLYVFALIPILGVAIVGLLLRSLQQQEEEVTPFIWTVSLFFLSFVGLGFLIFPSIIPPSVTIYEAAASPSSLVFMAIFVGFLIPILLAYTVYNYFVFRGKIDPAQAYGDE